MGNFLFHLRDHLSRILVTFPTLYFLSGVQFPNVHVHILFLPSSSRLLIQTGAYSISLGTSHIPRGNLLNIQMAPSALGVLVLLCFSLPTFLFLITLNLRKGKFSQPSYFKNVSWLVWLFVLDAFYINIFKFHIEYH